MKRRRRPADVVAVVVVTNFDGTVTMMERRMEARMLQHQTCLIDVNKTLPAEKTSWLNRCDATHNGKRNVKKPLRGDERTQRYHDLEREREGKKDM